MLEEEGLEPVEIRQNFTHMSDPMREIEAALISGDSIMTDTLS